jgi:hypothetical protein
MGLYHAGTASLLMLPSGAGWSYKQSHPTPSLPLPTDTAAGAAAAAAVLTNHSCAAMCLMVHCLGWLGAQRVAPFPLG